MKINGHTHQWESGPDPSEIPQEMFRQTKRHASKSLKDHASKIDQF
jgi:hypothetical protein